MLQIALLAACVGIEGRIAPMPEGVEDVGGVEYAGAAPRPEPPERVPTTQRPRGWLAPIHDREPPERVPGDVLFAWSDTPQRLAITLSEAAIDALREEPTEEVQATLEWHDHVYTVALRLKGSRSFRPIDEKPSFKIDVHAFDADAELDGIERLTLNNMIQDETMLREHAFYWMAARLGLPAPRQAYARVSVNGDDYGVYSVIETMDEELVERLFPEDPAGNLYESSGCDFTYARNWFDLEEDGGVVESPDDIDDLVDAVEATRLGGFDAMLSERFDRDRVLTYLALDLASGNPDGYAFNHHNYFAYGDTTGRWTLLPWGTDQAFRNDVSPLGDLTDPVVGQLVAACWADAACAEGLRGALHDVVDVWESELVEHVEDVEDIVDDLCDGDPRAEDPCAVHDTVAFIRARPTSLNGYL